MFKIRVKKPYGGGIFELKSLNLCSKITPPQWLFSLISNTDFNAPSIKANIALVVMELAWNQWKIILYAMLNCLQAWKLGPILSLKPKTQA